ncbi:MAG: hypothetical protein CL450_04205 [Acidimicrobiaceae bacterium]|nr:hypothetical protein [Acidimicrobiaceae bacterium]
MWGLVLLFVFVIALSIALRHTRRRRVRKKEDVIIAVLPIVVEHGMPVAVLHDDTRAQIAFDGAGLQSNQVPFSGVQVVEVQEGARIKAPVRLSRTEEPRISALSLGPDVKAVTLDFGTRQMMLHGTESSSPAQFHYTQEKDGQVVLTPVRGKTWNRMGSVSMDLGRLESRGATGVVSCDDVNMRVTRGLPSQDTVVGRRDILEGKYRMTFNLGSKTAFIQ